MLSGQFENAIKKTQAHDSLKKSAVEYCAPEFSQNCMRQVTLTIVYNRLFVNNEEDILTTHFIKNNDGLGRDDDDDDDDDDDNNNNNNKGKAIPVTDCEGP
jgi:hypothetical protein